MEVRVPTPDRKESAWSACPNCGANLRTNRRESSRPYLEECPFCRTQIEPALWQRIIWLSLGLYFAFAVPAALGMSGWTVFFLGLLLLFPSHVLAMIVVFTVMGPKYVRQKQATLTLFRR